MSKIPVSAIIVAKNEEANIGRCLEALSGFDEIVIVDSNSQDATVKIARDKGARIFPFYWNGRYPKKRQWALENIDISHDWVFFVDADEVVTQKLSKSIKRIFENGTPRYVGYFIKGCYVWKGKLLSFGMTNNKLALFDRRYIEFPLVNDLDIPGMGEIEGHYQPVLKKGASDMRIGRLRTPLIHHAADDIERWKERHVRYALWENEMIARNAYPEDPSFLRQKLKEIFRSLPFRGMVVFVYSYILRLGFLDGKPGYEFAKAKSSYYCCRQI